MAKQLYDYWFVQFDFPNENGKPYKSSGGKMVWNEKLKREIPKGWNVLKLGEHCSFNKRTSNGYFNHPILYLDTSNITNNTIDELQFLNPSSDIIPSRARRLVQEGDIVYSTVRPNLKHFGIIMNPDYNMVVSTGFAVITANWSAYRYFIYQFLIQAATIENLSTIAQSAVSAYPSINTSDIENLDLEALAKQLYDYWFVQFDFPDENGRPYKSSGGKMVWNDKLKREIPEGWDDGILIDIANITMGQSPDGSSYNEVGEGMLFYQGSTDFGMRFPSVRQYTTAPSRFAKKGDILMSVRAPVGSINIANNDCCIGRGLSAINSKLGSISHLYYILNDLRIAFDQRNAAGTTFGSITKEDLYSLPIIIPSDEVIRAFDKICSPMFDRQMILGEEIDILTKQRDELLPHLMNGQVSVNSDLSVYKKRRGKVPLLDSKRCVRHLSPSSAIHNCFGQRILDR